MRVTYKGCRTRAPRGFRAPILIASTFLSSAPGKGGRTDRPKRHTRCYADSGCGTGGGDPSFSGRGLFLLRRMPHPASWNGTAQTLRLPAVHHGGGKVGATPRSEPPAVNPEVDPDEGRLAENLRLPSHFLGWGTRGTHHECA